MKTVLTSIYTYICMFNQARAAASLARHGDHAGARAVYKD
jgi:hypothetical protein